MAVPLLTLQPRPGRTPRRRSDDSLSGSWPYRSASHCSPGSPAVVTTRRRTPRAPTVRRRTSRSGRSSTSPAPPPTSAPRTPKGIRTTSSTRTPRAASTATSSALTWQDYGYKVPRPSSSTSSTSPRAPRCPWAGARATPRRCGRGSTPTRSRSCRRHYAETLTDPKVTPYNFFPGAELQPADAHRPAVHRRPEQGQEGRGGRASTTTARSAPRRWKTGRSTSPTRSSTSASRATPCRPAPPTTSAQIGQAKAQGAKYVIIQNVSSGRPPSWPRTWPTPESTAQIVCLNWCADELFVKLAGPAAEKMIAWSAVRAAGGRSRAGLEEINNFLKAKNTDASTKGLHYVQGWYTMARWWKGSPTP